MILGERALAAEARGDGRRQQLGEARELGPGLRVVHALAGIDHRPLGLDQAPCRLAHRIRIGARAQRLARPVVKGSATSSVNTSTGTSTRAGAPRPLRRRVKARRRMLGISAAEVTGSADLVTPLIG